MEKKICKYCKEEKEISKFNGYITQKGWKPTTMCKPCKNKRRHIARMEDSEKESLRKRIHRLKYKYGITLEDYNKMYIEQQGLCKICANYFDKLVVDHCYTTGKVRGLLCNYCNFGLGNFKDNTNLLNRAIIYLIDTQIDKK